MFVLVNFMQENQTVTVDNLRGTWHNFRRNSMIAGNTFQMKAHEVIIGTNTVKDEGLPTYQDTLAMIEKLEAQRLATCSKLVDCRHQIALSGLTTSKFKWFNGTRDDLALTVGATGERFVEADLTKVNVTCNKIVVNGWNLKGHMTVKVKLNGEFTLPEGTEVVEEELATSYIFKEEICPEVIRMDFFGDEVMEIYELEAF